MLEQHLQRFFLKVNGLAQLGLGRSLGWERTRAWVNEVPGITQFSPRMTTRQDDLRWRHLNETAHEFGNWMNMSLEFWPREMCHMEAYRKIAHHRDQMTLLNSIFSPFPRNEEIHSVMTRH